MTPSSRRCAPGVALHVTSALRRSLVHRGLRYLPLWSMRALLTAVGLRRVKAFKEHPIAGFAGNVKEIAKAVFQLLHLEAPGADRVTEL